MKIKQKPIISLRFIAVWFMLASVWRALAVDPIVSNVRAKQREGSRLVDITYDVADSDSPTVQIVLKLKLGQANAFDRCLTNISGDVGYGIKVGSGKKIVWNAGLDLSKYYSSFVKYQVVANDVTPDGPVDCRWIKPGIFLMGSPINEGGRSTDEVQHRVTLSNGFWICDHEVTQAEFKAVMGYFRGLGGQSFDNPSSVPVVQITWNEAMDYCAKLTKKQETIGILQHGMAWRLPTEAEWEYVARAGSTGWQYPDGSSSGPTQLNIVKKGRPNPWGVFDMSGNAWEWCLDWYGEYPTEDVIDPVGPKSGTARVIRGIKGISAGPDADGRPAKRGFDLGFPLPYTGFRIVLSKVL